MAVLKIWDGSTWVEIPVGATDHGALGGLGDDDHSIYILVDGTRAFTGNQSMGSNKLTNLANATAAQDAMAYGQRTHTVLDADYHSDSVADGVTRGSIIVGNSTPKWDELVVGTQDECLRVDSNGDAVWNPIPDGSTISKYGYNRANNVAATNGTWTDINTYISGDPDPGPLDAGNIDYANDASHFFLCCAVNNNGAGGVDQISFRLYDVDNAAVLVTIAYASLATRSFVSDSTFSNIPTANAFIKWQYRTDGTTDTFAVFGHRWSYKKVTS